MLDVSSETEPTEVGSQHVSVGLEEQINRTLHSFGETESIGIIMERKSKKSDKEAMQFLFKKKSVQFEGG